MTSSTFERFGQAVTVAIKLPTPRDIARAIMTGTPDVDDGLRAASYDGDRVTGGTSTSHVERMVARRNPTDFPKDNPTDTDQRTERPKPRGAGNRAGDDLYRLSKASERAVDAIAALVAICRDEPPPNEWTDLAWHCQVLLGERCDHPGHDDHPTGSDNPHDDCQTLDTITPALEVNHEGAVTWAERFVTAIGTVTAIRDTWMAHAPSQGLAEENQAWCRSHLRIDVNRKRVTRLLCQLCWRDVCDLADLGEPVELQNDPRNWPSEPMLQAREDGRDVLFKRERQDWLRSKGLDPARVHQQRQDRRSA